LQPFASLVPSMIVTTSGAEAIASLSAGGTGPGGHGAGEAVAQVARSGTLQQKQNPEDPRRDLRSVLPSSKCSRTGGGRPAGAQVGWSQ
jgi:hypothetical protein